MLTALRIKHQNELAATVQGRFTSSGTPRQEDLPVGDLRENQRQVKDRPYRWQLRLREITPYLANQKKH